jgi:hypothetical protein
MFSRNHDQKPAHRPRRTLSYANIVSTLALVLALGGGSAYAAKHYLITSTKQIKPSVLKSLRGHGTTGKVGATGPGGTTLGASGGSGSGLVTWRTTVQTAGASPSAPAIVTLATVGPFTITGECYSDGQGNTDGGTYLQTSETNSSVEDNGEYTPLSASDGPTDIDTTDASGTTVGNEEDFEGADGGTWAAESANGSIAIQGLAAQGVWMQGASGPACSFSGFLVSQ